MDIIHHPMHHFLRENSKVQAVEHLIEHQEMNPIISYNTLAGITSPQTLNIEGHIKK